MLNQAVIVGRQKGSLIKDSNAIYIDVAVPRSYKSEDGNYEVDTIRCELYKNIATNVEEYCNENDMLGIKGRIQVIDGIQSILAEKVTFLSSRNAN